MGTTYQSLIPEPVPGTNGQILILRLNRPEVANALNTALALEIRHFFASLPDSPCRVVILTGMGKHFCAGADLKDRKGMTDDAWHEQHAALEGAHRAILACPVPVIAAVHGASMGGGLEIAMACDFIYAADDARFALTETTLGIMPGLGGTQLLPRKIGHARAAELTYLGRPFSAADAYSFGLVNHLFPAGDLLANTIACAQTIAKNAPLAVAAVKAAMNEGATLSLNEALACELNYYNSLLTTQDRQEGINAFNEKRPPVFTGN